MSDTRSDVKCPSEYTKIDYDLNKDANGNYVYLCKKYGVDNEGIKDIKILDGTEKCPNGYTELDFNLNDGVPNFSK